MLTSYINQIKNFEILTKEQESDLAQKIKAGNKKAFEKLINCNLKLVVSIAKKYANVKIDIMDLIQEGNMALITAAEKFDIKFNTRFSTYAYLWITQAMLRFIRNKMPIISIPGRKEIAIRKVKSAEDILTKINGVAPTRQEIAIYLSITEQEVKEIQSNIFTVTSLDSKIEKDSDSSFEEFISDNLYNQEDSYFEEEFRIDIEDMLNTLPKIEKDVIYYRFNFGKDEKRTPLRSVASKVGISSESVRQVELRALRKLKSTMESCSFYA